MFTLPQWLFPGDGRPQREIDDEITEELQLHLDLLAEERMRAGEAPDEARQHAAERFGDFDKFLRQCRVEKQGDAPMLKRIQVVATVLLLIVVSLLTVRDYVSAIALAEHMDQTTAFLKTIKEDLDDLRGADTPGASPAQTDPATEQPNAEPETYIQPIELFVVDPDNKPIEGACVFVTFSQKGFNGSPFADRRFREQGVATREGELTSSEGYFRATLALFKDYIQTDLTFVCVAPGYAIARIDTVITGGQQESRRLTLSPSTPVKLRIVGQDGKPIRRMSVFPYGRTDLDDRSHYLPEGLTKNAAHRLIDFNASNLRKQTDDNGEVTVDWFAARDLAQITLKPRGEPLGKAPIQFEVPSDPNQIVGIAKNEASVRGGFGEEYTYRVLSEGDKGSKAGGGRRSGRRGGEFGGGGFEREFGGGFGGGFGRPANSDLADLTGAVTTADGAPIAGADVLLIVKTWPNGRYRQDDYALKTDAQGRYTLEGKIPRNAMYGINAAIVADGHALASEYVLVEEPAGLDLRRIDFTLTKTRPTLLSVVDAQGNPTADALVTPSERRAPDKTVAANIYFQGSEAAQRSTDRDGNVEIDWFAEGDAGKVWIKPQGGQWSEHSVAINGKTATVILE